MKITEKKTESITIRLTEEIKAIIEKCAIHERRKPAELVALWVKDVALEEIKKLDKSNQVIYRR